MPHGNGRGMGPCGTGLGLGQRERRGNCGGCGSGFGPGRGWFAAGYAPTGLNGARDEVSAARNPDTNRLADMAEALERQAAFLRAELARAESGKRA